MSTMKGVAEMYDALRTIKAMDAPVKLDIRIPCRMTLLLAMAVEQALSSTEPGNLFRKIVPEDDRMKLVELSVEILRKGELEEFYKRLKELAQG